ncbi:hypothetical protein HDV05_008475 [Chytridiales sp. JEL 0842]|nr:hypothetical protein HDV05_008475 [Chytridiales sp. JEL 0842]
MDTDFLIPVQSYNTTPLRQTFKATGFEFCPQLNGAEFDSTTYIIPLDDAYEFGRISESDFVKLIDETARQTLQYLNKMSLSIDQAAPHQISGIAIDSREDVTYNQHTLSASQVADKEKRVKRRYGVAFLITLEGKDHDPMKKLVKLVNELDDGTALIMIQVDAQNPHLAQNCTKWLDERYKSDTPNKWSPLKSTHRINPETGGSFKVKDKKAEPVRNVFMSVRPRKIYSSTISLVYAWLEGFWELLDAAEWTHIINLSVRDFPLKQSRHIHRWLAKRGQKSLGYLGHSFMEYEFAWDVVSKAFLPNLLLEAEDAIKYNRSSLPIAETGFFNMMPFPGWAYPTQNKRMILSRDFVRFLRHDWRALELLAASEFGRNPETFIHGFLGSEASFASYPEHLIACIQQTHPHVLDGSDNTPKIELEAKCFPRFETKGHNGLAVKTLVDWLLLNATTVLYDAVILLAHSMGGLMAADAYSLLYELDDKALDDDSDRVELADQKKVDAGDVGGTKTNASWVASAMSKLAILRRTPTSTNTENNPQDNSTLLENGETECLTRHLVNIRGILTFDSPFYGLSSSVVTSAGTNKALNAVSTISSVAGAVAKGVAESAAKSIPTFSTATEDAASKVGEKSGLHGGWSLPASIRLQQESKGDADKPEWMKTKGGQAEAEVAKLEAKGLLKAPTSLMTEEEKSEELVGETLNQSNEDIVMKVTTTTSTTMTSTTVKTSTGITETTSGTSSSTTSLSASWTSVAKYALIGAAGAAALYSTAGVARFAASTLLAPSANIVRGVATKWALRQVEEARSHAEFLFPLVNTYAEMHARIRRLMVDMEKRNQLHFHGFYLELPPLVNKAKSSNNVAEPPPPNAMPPETNNPELEDNTLNEARGVELPDDPNSILQQPLKSTKPKTRNFCVPPPLSTEHLFEKIRSPLGDEIDAHMELFNASLNGMDYVTLVVNTSQQVVTILEKYLL